MLYYVLLRFFEVRIVQMDLLEEAAVMGVPVELGSPVIHCKKFEDNSGALQLV